MSLKLRDLIRQVRACKTAAEERAVIAKESAMIRTAIREEQEQYRHRNVAKLLFMHMLGYPTHFGQLECLKLIASPHFPEKRIGYLGLMLLLSEKADVLMLATNSLKNDLNCDNKYVAGLALCAIGNLSTADMSRDLAPEIEKHLKSHSPYLRKKACLAMSRCLVKVPEMIEDFVDRAVELLKDRSHGVLITVLELMTQVCIIDIKLGGIGDDDDEDEDEKEEEDDEDKANNSIVRKAFIRLVPALVKLLRNLLSMGYSPDHDINGISDPFLQVQILTLLRLLGTGDSKTSELMNDVLAQVATNTETSKNAGNAILYECVQTIMAIPSEDGLRVLAINILGRFLLNRDNNIRYVALNTLSSCVVGEDAASVQRHRQTIVDCLKDPDISIRQRSLELIYHLVNNENVEALTAELLNYLVLCPREHRKDICTRVLRVVHSYSPEDRWRVDTLITMLTIAGRECDSDVQSATIVYISRASEDLRAYATHKLLKAIRDDDGTQQGLLVVGIWCIGEYGDFLLKPYSYTPPPSPNAAESGDTQPVTISFMALEPSSIIKTVEDASKQRRCPEIVIQRAITCFAKLHERFADSGDTASIAKLVKLVQKYRSSHSLELQLRSCELGALIAGSGGDSLIGNAGSMSAAKEVLARMPVVDSKIVERRQRLAATNDFGQLEMLDDDGGNKDVAASLISTPAAADNSGGGLLDLEDIFGAPSETTNNDQNLESNSKQSNGQSSEKPVTGKSDVDLLSDIFSTPAAASVPLFPSSSAGTYDPFSQQPPPIIANSTPVPSQMPPVTVPDIFANPVPVASTMTPMAPVPVAPLNVVVPTPVPLPIPTGSTVSSGATGTVVSAFAKDGLEIEFECTKPDAFNRQKSEVLAKFKNTTGAPIYGLNLQCAVPKYVTMDMLPPSSTTIPERSGGTAKEVTQLVKVTNTMLGTKKLLMKLKISFTTNGNKVDHMSTFSSFPDGY